MTVDWITPVYRFLAPAAVGLLPLAGKFSAKLRRGVEGRRGLDQRIRAAAPTLQGCYWFHASSVGEYEQARPVIEALKETGQGPVAVTHFSPSGYDYALDHPCGDHHDYLPWDTPEAMAKLVTAWAPRCLICVKYDGWPHQVSAAAEAGVPVVMVSGALPPRAGRLHPLLRSFTRNVYSRFAAIGVGSSADRKRFLHLLGEDAPVVVTGDTRAEQVLRRFEHAAGGTIATALSAWGDRRLILGSTWPPDEDLWFPVLRPLLDEYEDLRLVLVPHEPTPDRVRALGIRLEAAGISHRRLSDVPAAGPGEVSCVLVDRVGVLAEIYRAGTIAHVGGGYTTGVHSTLEPAVAGLPVTFGPRIDNAEEALLMVRREGGYVLYEDSGARLIATRMLEDETLRVRAGSRARAVVTAQLGATERSLRLILETVERNDQR